MVGQEVRAQIEGIKAAKMRHGEREYDLRIRLKDEQRNLQQNFKQILVPNLNNRLVRLSDVASGTFVNSPESIFRQDRVRYVLISADINPSGKGMAFAMQEVQDFFKNPDNKISPRVTFSYDGEAKYFSNLLEDMVLMLILAIFLIYVVLASLYESFITPLTIMLAIPLAANGAIYALLATNKTLDIFSIIGCILLLGIATKNSIILVDYIRQTASSKGSSEQAYLEACVTRFKPILMTAIALVVGMLPLALGLNEASSQRNSMGVAVIGGVISSTILTLYLVPVIYPLMQGFEKMLHRFAFKFLTKP